MKLKYLLESMKHHEKEIYEFTIKSFKYKLIFNCSVVNKDPEDEDSDEATVSKVDLELVNDNKTFTTTGVPHFELLVDTFRKILADHIIKSDFYKIMFEIKDDSIANTILKEVLNDPSMKKIEKYNLWHKGNYYWYSK